jgi:quinol monooxygenase YgiN
MPTVAGVLTVIAKVRAAKGKGDAMAALLMAQVAIVNETEPGCLIYRPHRSTADPDLFVFYEQYEDEAAFATHQRAPCLDSFRERCEREGLTEGPADEAVEVEVYRSMTD